MNRHFTEEEVQMDHYNRKTLSAPLLIGEIKIKGTVNYFTD